MTETVTWRVALREGARLSITPLVAGEMLEEYLQIDGKMYRLRWQQAQMREAEYVLMAPVAQTDTAPEPT